MKRVLVYLSLLGLLAALVAGCTTPPPPLASKIPGTRWEFDIIKTTVSNDVGIALIAFKPRYGIFAFHLEPLPPKLNKLSLGILKERYCEGLLYQPTGKTNEFDLLRAKGVNVAPEFDGIVIEIRPPALDLLQPGGRVMFINQYR